MAGRPEKVTDVILNDPVRTAAALTGDTEAQAAIKEEILNPAPEYVQFSTPGYPGNIGLFFHADGKVTWK